MSACGLAPCDAPGAEQASTAKPVQCASSAQTSEGRRLAPKAVSPNDPLRTLICPVMITRWATNLPAI